MKKWVFGCLGLLLIVGVGGGYLGYRFLYLPGKAYVQSFTQLKVIPELNAKVENKTPFTAPAGDVLTTQSVERLIRTQKAIHENLGARVKELEAKYKTVNERLKNSDERPSFGEMMSALKDLSGLFVDAKEAQVQALNAEGLSLAEYEWTRARVYEALGIPINTTLQQIIRDAASGKAPDVEAIKNPPEVHVPEANREVVKPYAKELTEDAALAFFAL